MVEDCSIYVGFMLVNIKSEKCWRLFRLPDETLHDIGTKRCKEVGQRYKRYNVVSRRIQEKQKEQ